MTEKAKYHTKQREKLLSFIQSISENHFTVADVCKHFEEQGEEIGVTTVYRQLEKMVNEGIVKKYIIDINTPACFEYIGFEEQTEEKNCFHCKCTECGKLIHLFCEDLLSTEDHILNHHGFQIDKHRTVFYGLCNECRESSNV